MCGQGWVNQVNNLFIIPVIGSTQTPSSGRTTITEMMKERGHSRETEEAGLKLLFSDACSTFLCWRQYRKKVGIGSLASTLTSPASLISSHMSSVHYDVQSQFCTRNFHFFKMNFFDVWAQLLAMKGLSWPKNLPKARVRKSKKIPGSKIFHAKTFRIKRVNCDIFDFAKKSV